MSIIDTIDHPLLWVVPFAGFTLISLLAIVNYFISFFPEGSGYLLMLSGCAFLCASVAGFITELIKGRTRHVYVSMGAASLLGCIVFFAGYGFFKSNLVTGTGQAVVPAVSDVSFDVHDGEVVSLIGESGSGKSTIGKMILRLLSVSSGAISFDGVDISTLEGDALKEYYRQVQGVFQDPFSSYNPIFKADRVFRVIRRMVRT